MSFPRKGEPIYEGGSDPGFRRADPYEAIYRSEHDDPDPTRPETAPGQGGSSDKPRCGARHITLTHTHFSRAGG